MPHKFDPQRRSVLVSDERHQRQPPARLLAAIGIRPGVRLADIGCGPGFHTLPAAGLVGPAGRVHALDVQEAMVAEVRQRAAAAGLDNVESLVCAEVRLPLPPASVDIALLANMLHECEDPVALLRDVRRILAPGGRAAVIEWRKEPMPLGPPLEERMTDAAVADALTAVGFAQPNPLDAAAIGQTHFGLVAARD